jgi:chaperonin GroES
MMVDKIKPLHDRVLIQRLEQEEKTAGGIIIPDAAKEKAQLGKVVAIGGGKRTDEGTVIPMAVQTGDVVFFGKYSGTEAGSLNGSDYLILREDEILGVVQK